MMPVMCLALPPLLQELLLMQDLQYKAIESTFRPCIDFMIIEMPLKLLEASFG